MLPDARLMLSVSQSISPVQRFLCLCNKAIVFVHRICHSHVLSKKKKIKFQLTWIFKCLATCTNPKVPSAGCSLAAPVRLCHVFPFNSPRCFLFSHKPKRLQSHRQRPPAERRESKGGCRLQSFHQGSWQRRAQRLRQRTQ